MQYIRVTVYVRPHVLRGPPALSRATREAFESTAVVAVQKKYICARERETAARKTPAYSEISELDEDESEESEAVCQIHDCSTYCRRTLGTCRNR